MERIGPLLPVFADSSTVTALALTEVPTFSAVASLVVEQSRFRNVDKVCNQSSQNPNQGGQYPTLSSVEPCQQSSQYVLPAAESLDTVCIGDAVVDPVGGGELIVPNAVVDKPGAYRIFEVVP